MKHKAHINTTGIKPMHGKNQKKIFLLLHNFNNYFKNNNFAIGGIDFYYALRQDAVKMVDFLTTTLPCKSQYAQELISHDTKNNTFDYKHTYSLEIVPICKVKIVFFL